MSMGVVSSRTMQSNPSGNHNWLICFSIFLHTVTYSILNGLYANQKQMQQDNINPESKQIYYMFHPRRLYLLQRDGDGGPGPDLHGQGGPEALPLQHRRLRIQLEIPFPVPGARLEVHLAGDDWLLGKPMNLQNNLLRTL